MTSNNLSTATLPVTYELDKSFDTERFIKMRLRVCHDGVNPNGSNFNIDDMNAAQDSLKNIPILANVVFDENDEPQFGAHDMAIEKDKVKDGEYRMVYKEVPIGVIPEINNYEVSQYNGKNYVFVDGYVWRKYSNYAEDIIERDTDIKLSMEISVNEFTFNAAKKIYNITDYVYTGITFLGNDVGTGMKDALATVVSFENNNTSNDMAAIMQELTEALVAYNAKNSEKGEEEVDMENAEVITSEVTTEFETVVESTAEVTDAVQEDVVEQVSAESEVQTFVKKFELSHEDIRCGLYALLEQRETEASTWYFIEAVYDDYFIYKDYTERFYYKQSFAKNGDDVSFSGEPVEVFVTILTKEEKDAVESQRANYAAMEAELGELRTYKQENIANQEMAEKQEVMLKWSENLKNNEKYEELKTKLDEYTAVELDRECKCIFADSKATFNFSQKNTDDGIVRIAVENTPETDNSPYGNLFAMYGNKK